MSVATFTKAGSKATTPAKLDKTVFGVEIKNHELLKAAYVAYLANGRTSAGNVKTRGLVSGGGRKPWKQKGTGRARFGSSRNPIWRGGGVVFGPTGNENYSHKLPVATKRASLRQALTAMAEANNIIVVEGLDFKGGKTSEAVSFLSKIGASKHILIVADNKTDEIMRATSNIQDVLVVQAAYLNTYDAMNADKIVITTTALKDVTDLLAVKTSKKAEA